MNEDTAVDLKDLERRMQGAFSALKSEFAGLRTGRASANLLDPVMVNAYGSDMPLSQVGTVNVPDSRMLSVSVWDKTLVSAVEKAIRDSGLGVNPVADGQTVRVPLPALTEERRLELAKLAGKYAEQARIAIRNVRRDGMEAVKKAEGMAEDTQKKLSDTIQKLTDEQIKCVDGLLHTKEGEIIQI